MKILLIAMLLISMSCLGQAPKRTNTIKVRPVSFRQVVNTLLDAGCTFKAIDSNYSTVTTEPRNYSRKSGGLVQFNIRVVDSVATITGFCGVNESDFSDNPGKGLMDGKTEIQNRGMKGSLLKEGFDAMDKLAKSLGGKVVYIMPE
jgi:hypothetical protein